MPKIAERLSDTRTQARKLAERAAAIHDGRSARSDPTPTKAEAAELATIDTRLADFSADVAMLEARERGFLQRLGPDRVGSALASPPAFRTSQH